MNRKHWKYFLRVVWRSKSCFACFFIFVASIWLGIHVVTSRIRNIPEIRDGSPRERLIIPSGPEHALSPVSDALLKQPPSTLAALAERVAGHGRPLAFSLVDKYYLDITLNFIATSLYALPELCPHVLICTDNDAKMALQSRGVYCFPYVTPGASADGKSGDFGSWSYFNKTHIKTWITMNLLRLNYSVLVIDPDVILFKDPFPYFECQDCDLIVSRDRVQVNTGFLLARPTKVTVMLYEETWKLSQKYNQSHDQSYFNMALDSFHIKKIDVKLQNLSPKQFLCGVYYFENGGRSFGGKPCPDCVAVHNNYIGSIAAKEYRFKENLLWMVDDNEYYSSRQARYLMYDNPFYFGDRTYVYEERALLHALQLGKMTGRIVILPKWHCCDCERTKCSGARHKCSMLSVLRIKSFDEIYKGKYRESTFLTHPLIPSSLKDQTLTPIILNTTIYEKKTIDGIYKSFTPNSRSLQTWQDTVMDYVKSFDSQPVIYFHSLYEAFPDGFMKYLKETRDKAFQCSTYEQWDVPTNNYMNA